MGSIQQRYELTSFSGPKVVKAFPTNSRLSVFHRATSPDRVGRAPTPNRSCRSIQARRVRISFRTVFVSTRRNPARPHLQRELQTAILKRFYTSFNLKHRIPNGRQTIAPCKTLIAIDRLPMYIAYAAREMAGDNMARTESSRILGERCLKEEAPKEPPKRLTTLRRPEHQSSQPSRHFAGAL